MKDVPLTLDKVSELKYVPQYPDVKTYVNVFGNLFQWEADDWQSASLSWKEAAISMPASVAPRSPSRGRTHRRLSPCRPSTTATNGG